MKKARKGRDDRVNPASHTVIMNTPTTGSQHGDSVGDSRTRTKLLRRVGIVLGGLGTLVGVAAAVFGLYPTWLVHGYSRPSMLLTLGTEFVKTEQYDIPSGTSSPTTLVYLVPDGGSSSIFVVPYTLKNDGAVALRDVAVHLIYDTQFAVQNEEIRPLENETVRVSRNTNILEARSCSPMGNITFVEYNIPIVRPGETTVFCDPMRVDVRNLDQSSTVRGDFRERLRATLRLVAYAEVACDVASDSIRFYRKNLSILWCRVPPGDEESVSQETTRIVTDAVWGGPHPGGGMYVKLPYKKSPFICEAVECVFPALQELTDKEKTSVKLEMVLESNRYLCSTLLPAWDYRGPVTWEVPEALWDHK